MRAAENARQAEIQRQYHQQVMEERAEARSAQREQEKRFERQVRLIPVSRNLSLE